MKPGDVLPVEIRDLDDEGAGVGAPAPATGAPFEVRVAGALPGERVTAELDHVSSHRPVGWALLRSVDRASTERVSPACAAWGPCGGCVLEHFEYGAQVAWKERQLRARVAALGDPGLGPEVLAPAIPSPRALGYRNKSKLVAGRDGSGRLILGAYAPRTHDVVDLAGCAIVEPPLDAIAGALRDCLDQHGVEPYDERRFQGTLRHAIVRVSASGAVLVTLVTARDAFPEGPALARALMEARPEVAGVVQNVNPSRGNAIYGADERTLAGAAHLEDRIGNVRLRLSSRAFLQANRWVAALAYEAIARGVALGTGDRVVDAYAGVGGIALTLASTVRLGEILGIEENAAAVEDATVSAALNGIPNARFVAADAARGLGEAGRADVVVLNPPRKGCAPAVLDATVGLGPRSIAYLSCAPETLLRDLRGLAERGYRTRTITPLDMLPHTPHLEALGILDRASCERV